MALRQWLVRAWATVHPGRNDADLEAELRTHLAMAADQAQRGGRTPEAAAREVALQFGGLSQAVETLRDQRGLRWLSDLLRDLRYGCRLLARSPGFALVTIVTLALGMGANLMIFCLAEALLLRPLPVAEPAQLVRIFSNNFSATPYTDYLDYRDSTRTLTSLAAFQLAPMSLRTSGAPERVFGMAVTGNYFDALGVHPSLGRTISEADDRIGAAGAAMLSDAFWRSRYGADPSVLGRIVILNGSPFTIVGVCPAAFKGTMAPLLPDVWIPWNRSVFAPSATTLRKGQSAQMIGRLDDHSSPQAVQAELTAVASAAANRNLQSNHITRISAYPARTLVPEFAPQVTVFVGFLMALVGLVLLITCVNIASLLLARAAARRHEIATRLALGANRRRIVVQLLTESLLLSVFGVAIALLLAVVMVRVLTSITLPAPFPIDLNLIVDWRVVVFAIALALLTTVLFGLAPALRASRSSLIAALKGVTTTSGREGSRSRTALVVAQVAMSTVLLITAGLLVRSLAAARDVNRGFSSDHVLAVSLDFDTRGYSPDRAVTFFERLLNQIEASPGIVSANLAEIVPLTLSNQQRLMLKDGQPAPQRGTGLPMIYSNAVSRGHFQTLQISLIAGRDFVATDRPGAAEVAIVNETLARRLWPNERPIGQRLREWRGNEAPGPWIEVIGLVRDSNYVTVGEDPKPFMYRPLSQAYSPAVSVLVRAHGEPMTALSAVRTAIEGLDPDLPAFGVTTLDAVTSISLLPVRTAAVLAMTLGAVALVLVAIGLHGIMSYLVRRRTRELGMRMALGAPPSSLIRMVTLQGLRWTVTGAVLGIVASFAVTRALTGLLYGIAPSDALVFLIVPAVLIGTAYLACHAPGRWASRVDPQVALKVD